MAGTGSSMLCSFLLFVIILSLQEMYRGKLASSELFTILGGFISSLIFLVLLTFIGNFQESCGMRTGWGAVLFSELVALVAASTVHRVCITTCFLFSAGLLYEMTKLYGVLLTKTIDRDSGQFVLSGEGVDVVQLVSVLRKKVGHTELLATSEPVAVQAYKEIQGLPYYYHYP
ncbi:hypothetical protein ACLOJK_041633 [Asimina triloba]